MKRGKLIFVAIVLFTDFKEISSNFTDPVGSTGCSKKYELGWCWRFCERTSGEWCYTSEGCKENEEQCGTQAETCSGFSCELAEPDCVQFCPQKIAQLQVENMIATDTTPNPASEISKGLDITKITILVGVAFLIVFFVVIFAFWRRNKRSKRQILTKREVEDYIRGCNSNSPDGKVSLENLKFPIEYEIPKKRILLLNLLGTGNFGLVYKGKITLKDNGTIFAAVKMPREDCPKESFKSMLSEVKVLCYVGSHPNIVGFLGVHLKDIVEGQLLIATELCENGSLLEYLRNQDNGNWTPTEANLSNLLRFCHETAQGMEYISNKNIIHGDLATRNVLLDSNLSCKVGDFGLSRKLYEYQQYVKSSKEPLPWRWLSLESLKKMEFTTKSDVWSFGVTMWEIYSLGCIPYPRRGWDDDFVNVLEGGFRLSAPQYAPNEMYVKMKSCWNENPDDRPNFSELCKFLEIKRQINYTTLNFA